MPTQYGEASKPGRNDPQSNVVLITLLGAIVGGLFNLPGLSQGNSKVGLVAFLLLSAAFTGSLLYCFFLIYKRSWRVAFPFAIVAITAGSLLLLTWLGIGSSSSIAAKVSPRIVAGLVYIDPAKSDSGYGVRLAELLREQKWQVTDDPARSAVLLRVQVETKTSPGLVVGGTTTWQADGEATLRATVNNSDQAQFSSVGRGHAVAVRSDHAADAAAAKALEQAADDFTAAARKEGN